MVKKIGKYIKGYWGYTIATPLLVLCETFLEIVIPFYMAKMIDQGINVGDMQVIKHYGIMLIGFALVSLIFGTSAAITSPLGSAGFAKNLRKAMYYKVQEFSFASIDKFSTGSIVTRLTTDVQNVQQAFQMITRICVRAPGMLIFALVAAFSVNRKLALVFLVAMPILITAAVILLGKVRPIFNRVFKTYDKLNNTVQENLSAVRVVKSYNRQDFENKKFKSVSGMIFKDFSNAEKTMAWVGPVMQFSMYLCVILIAWIGAKMIVASGNNEALGLTTGQLMSMITYTTQILMSLMMISVVFVMLTMAIESAKRIIEILEEDSEIKNPENAVMDVKDGSIDFENVDFEYIHKNKEQNLTEEKTQTAGRKVLEGINIHIDSGMTVGVMGGTGSSKSSLVQLIPRLYDVTGGSIKVGGVDVRDYDIESLRNAVSMVLQKNVLFSGSIVQNLRWGNENASFEEIKHACHVACCDEFISTFEDGYNTHIEQGGTNVSGGQRQRLCIARALLKNPKILILDDSTSACDMKTDAMIRESLAHEKSDVTKIIIAQRIASIKDSDLIIVMDNGRIAAMGKHEDLLESNEIYREVYETQNKMGQTGGDFDA